MTANYVRLPNGAWGVRVTGAQVRVGEQIEVTRRGAVEGETQTETVAAIVRTDRRYMLVSIAPRPWR